MRTGLGVDAHRFAPGRRLILGGVDVPYEMGLAGHSDADVVLHALMDALLGACAAGDIGEMFPDSEERFRDASSMELLAAVADRVASLGFHLVNADVVVICEEPKVAPVRDEIRRNIASVLGVEEGAVFVKGTTTEGMGFPGRSEGIMAVASVLIDR